MKNLSSALHRLRRFHLLASVLIVCLLITIGIISWNSQRSSAQYQSRINIINHQIHTPDLLIGKISLLDGSIETREEIKSTVDQWVSDQERLQKGAPTLRINDPADPEILEHFHLIDPGFRRVTKAIRNQLSDSTHGQQEEIINQLHDYSKEYEIGMTGIKQMWTTGFQRLNNWGFITQMILILLTIGLILLESMFIGKPVLGFLENNLRRKETLKEAERSHLKMVRELGIKKTTKTAPAIGKKAQPTTKDEEKLAVKFPASILVVEDHPANQKYVQKLFQKLGYEVQLASNGREAVGMALTMSFDLIFMDIQMPIMDGIQASYEILGSLEAHEQPTIIALTGSAEPEIQEQCLDVGMKDIIWKPVKREQVTEAIIKWRKVVA